MPDSLTQFKIDHSPDGQTWSPLLPDPSMTVGADGKYHYTDPQPLQPDSYYRIRETTAGGTVVPYNVLRATTRVPGGFSNFFVASSGIRASVVGVVSDGIIIAGTGISNGGLFVQKLDFNLDQIWTRPYLGDPAVSVSGIAIDAGGNIFLCGIYNNLVFDGTVLPAGYTIFSAFVVKLQPDGTYNEAAGSWSRGFTSRYGSSQSNVCTGIGTSNGNVVIVGKIRDADFGNGYVGPGAFVVSLSGVSGTYGGFQHIYDTGTVEIDGMLVDGSDSIYLVGQCPGGYDFGGGPRGTPGGYSTAYILKLLKSGSVWNHNWSVGYSATYATFSKIAFDQTLGLAVTGTYYGTITLPSQFDSANPLGAWVSPSNSQADGIVARFSASAGACLWAKHLYATTNTTACACRSACFDGLGNILVTGLAYSTIDFGDGHVIPSKLFVAKYSTSTTPVCGWVNGYTGSVNAYQVNAANHNPVLVGDWNGTVDFGDPTGAKTASGQTGYLLKLNP